MNRNATIAIIIVVAVLIGLYLGGRRTDVSREEVREEPVFCTMDAKLCPDGSYVGRVPPSCEFSPCPGEAESS